MVIHLRQGDAMTTGRSGSINNYNKKIINILPKLINNFKDYIFYIHTDGNADFITNILLKYNVKYVVYSKNENVLNLLSDFIHSNVSRFIFLLLTRKLELTNFRLETS